MLHFYVLERSRKAFRIQRHWEAFCFGQTGPLFVSANQMGLAEVAQDRRTILLRKEGAAIKNCKMFKALTELSLINGMESSVTTIVDKRF